MHATPSHRYKPNPARIASWARLWLSCIAILLSCAHHLLPSAHRRRLPLLDVPRTILAGYVARLIFLCAVDQAGACANLRQARQPGALRALLRAGTHRHLVNTHGALDLARIAHTCAHPDAAIADMIAALEHGLTRREPIVARPANETPSACAPRATISACDTS